VLPSRVIESHSGDDRRDGARAYRARSVGRGLGPRYRPVFAGVFGLVHGAGFANYLRSLFVDRIAVPLFGFNLGLEVGQLIVIALAFISFAAIDRVIGVVVSALRRPDVGRPLRIRTLAVSVVVMSVASRWMLERYPW
jgi:hypothetical protein